MQAPARVYLLPLAITITALIIAVPLVYWLEAGSETIYDGLSYSVTYKLSVLDKLTGSSGTRIKLIVLDELGKPLTFTALLSGPSSEGIIEVASVSGRGYAVVDVSAYTLEVKRVLEGVNSDPGRSGLGVLILISTIVGDNEGEYAAVGAVSVPVIPDKAVGRDIIVTVKFRPVMKYRVGDAGGGYLGWRLADVLYATKPGSWDYVPVAAITLSERVGSNVVLIHGSLGIIGEDLFRLLGHARFDRDAKLAEVHAIGLGEVGRHFGIERLFGFARPRPTVSWCIDLEAA
ncbi:MAG: hypothetical protein ACK4H7_04935, partial [Acidilobaceae archaeon]